MSLIKKTKQINVGGILIGGGAPITVQSMTTVKTDDIPAVTAQITALANAGCDIVRLAVPNRDAALAIADIKRSSPLPIVADVHFDYKLAILAAEAGADKIRINPGNIGNPDNLKALVLTCKKFGIPIRIGVNSGSIKKELLAKYGAPSVPAMLDSALEHISLLNSLDFDDICISLKASDTVSTVAANVAASERFDYPLHIGITEAGRGELALIKSAVGIGSLLLCHIGDTIRVSLTGDPLSEVEAAINILRATGLRNQGVEIISCPTCGRTELDLEALCRDVESALRDCNRNIKVAVMGCEVNGPGEAASADYGIAAGKNGGILFKKGQRIAKVHANDMADALCRIIKEDGRVR